MLILMAIGVAVTALAHMSPAPFVIDWMAGERAVWSMPRTGVPTGYLTFDDGPNPSTTPDLLDVLAAENAPATFFIIDEHLNEQTAPIVRRAFASDGDIIVMHDGDESAPTRDQRHTVDATRRLIPDLRSRGFTFGTIC